MNDNTSKRRHAKLTPSATGRTQVNKNTSAINTTLIAARVAAVSLLENGLKLDECIDNVIAIERKGSDIRGSFWRTLLTSEAKSDRADKTRRAAHTELKEFIVRYKCSEEQLKEAAGKLSTQGYRQLPRLDLPWHKYRLSPSMERDFATGLYRSVMPIRKDVPNFSVALISAQNYLKALDKIIFHEEARAHGHYKASVKPSLSRE